MRADKPYARLHQQILGSITDAGSLLIVQHTELEDEIGDAHGANFDSVAMAHSVFSFAAETKVASGGVLDSLGMIRAIVRESSFSNFCLFPSWTELSRRFYSDARYDELQHKIREQYSVAQGRISVFVLAIYDVLESMTPGSRLLVMAPAEILTDRRTSRLRSYIASGHILRWIVEFAESPLPQLHPSFMVCSLLIEAGQHEFHPIKMLRFPQVADTGHNAILDEVSKLGRQQGGQTTHGYVLREPLPEEVIWGFSANHPKWNEYVDDLASVGGILRLAEVADVFIGRPGHRRDDKGRVIKNAALITGKDISREGHLVIDLENEKGPVYEGHHLLEPEDIVMRSLVRPANKSSIPAALVPYDSEVPLYAGQGTIVVRSRKLGKGLDPEWLLYYLQSRRAADWLFARMRGLHIYRKLIRELPIPVRDEDTAALWEQAAQLIDEFTKRRNRLDDARRHLFQHKTVKAGHAELIDVTLGASQQVQAARAAETFEWTVRNLYPYPLAFRWREIETMSVSYEKYRRILDAAEVLTTYLAIMGLVLAENYHDGELPGYLRTIAERLAGRPKSGMTFGDWLAILTEVAKGKKYRSAGPGTPFFEMASLFETKNAEQAFRRLKNWRDDDAHGRGPRSDIEIADAVSNAESTLKVAYRKADFVTKYELRFIEDTVHRARQNQIEYAYRALMGDHPLVPTEQSRRPGKTPIQQGALYFATPDEELYLVQPWLVRRACPTCGNKEVYAFDRLGADSNAVLIKSLDYGHVMEAEELKRELKSLGILLA